jgi:hypothetical protein
MVKRFVMFVLAVGLSATASAQDARAVLQASLKAMGGENLKTIQYSGAGWSSAIGQTYGLDTDWPHFEVAAYTRVIDYEAKWSREDYTRRQGSYPTFGRVPALTPHGALKAGLAATDATAITTPIVGPSDFGLSQFGRKVTIVSFTLFGKYKMNVTVNDQNLVELVDTWFPNPVYGDMDYEMRYTQYKDFGGIQFPQLVHVHQGDPRLNPAHNYYEFKVTEVKGNVPVEKMPVPEAVRNATIAPAKVESQKLADGVWALSGGTHNSMLVEFKDFVAVVEAPNNEARSLALIAEAGRLVPNKPIKYLVNTHHHFDHAGGLRTFLAQGTAIVTHESNKPYYLDIMFYPAPRTLDPDRMAIYSPMYMISRRPAPIETVGGDTRSTAPFVITDGVRMLEVFHVQDMAYELGDPSLRQGNHSQDMLMAYLPKERILYNADLYSPPAAGAALPAQTPANKTLHQNIVKLKLDVAQHVPTHGRVGTNDEFLKIFGKTGNTN